MMDSLKETVRSIVHDITIATAGLPASFMLSDLLNRFDRFLLIGSVEGVKAMRAECVALRTFATYYKIKGNEACRLCFLRAAVALLAACEGHDVCS